MVSDEQNTTKQIPTEKHLAQFTVTQTHVVDVSSPNQFFSWLRVTLSVFPMGFVLQLSQGSLLFLPQLSLLVAIL